MLTINNKKISFNTPVLMGILNITTDSFYDGGKWSDEESILKQTQKMVAEGAIIIDIGGQSTKPGATAISVKEELERVIPVIKIIKKRYPQLILSVDTYRSEVAYQSIEAGANIINDISGGNLDNKMFETVAKLNVPYVLTHIKGMPENMQNKPQYENVVAEVKLFFKEKLEQLNKLGASNIILDPGFGFGKTIDHNYELLKNLKTFKELGFPILVGISRKSMINKIINTTPENALNGTTVLNTIALLNGANILRVHDVKEANETMELVEYYKNTKTKDVF